MTVTVDAATENVRTGTTSPQTFSHVGAASGVKGVVLAIVHGVSATDHVSAASYGGVAMTRIQRNTDTVSEPGAAEIWFLGASVPQGTQTVSYTPGATTDDIHAVAITLLGAADLEVVDQDGVSENVANPSVTLQYGGRTCMAFAALYGGASVTTAFVENANCTRVHDHDLGAFYSVVCRQTTAGSADFAIGGTATDDDVAYSAIAVSEVQGGVTVTPGTLALVLATFAAVVTATANVLVTPGPASLTTTAFAPTVTATDHKTVTPGTASLTLTAFAPTVTATDNKTVTPTTASLALTTFAPTVTAGGGGITVTPTTAALTTASFAPTVTASDHKTVTPGVASLSLATYAPTVTRGVTAPNLCAADSTLTFADTILRTADATLCLPIVLPAGPIPAGAPVGAPARRRYYVMPDGRTFFATTEEVVGLLQLYAVPKESIAQLAEAPKAQPTIRAPQITLQKRDVRFVPAELPNTYKAVISERFTYNPPPESARQAEIFANRMRADEEAILALLM